MENPHLCGGSKEVIGDVLLNNYSLPGNNHDVPKSN